MTPLAPLVTAFFRKHLAAEKGVGKNTLTSYSYAFKFLCRYVSGRLGKSPSELSLEDLDAPMVRDFLEHLERDCGNTTRTRNLRLTAVRSFMKYVEYEVPAALEQVRRVLAISNKRTEERLVNHLTRDEMKAILDAPDARTRTGRRDQAMLYLGFAAGLRVSELVGLRLEDVELDGPYPSLLVRGKARQQRRLPLWKEAARALRGWLAVRGDAPVPEVFLNLRGEALTCSGFSYIVKKYVQIALPHSPGLSRKRVPSRAASHLCDEQPPGDAGHPESRPMAGTLQPEVHGDLPAGGPHREAHCDRVRLAPGSPSRRLPGRRPTPRLAFRSDDIRSAALPRAHQPRNLRPRLRIVVSSGQHELSRARDSSCKRRGFCPSCSGRRMAETAAHLVDCVLPEVPIRQWVLTLPYPLRYRCAYDAALTSEVLRAFLRALFSSLRRRAKRQWGAPRGQCGSVTFIQRFGSALNLNGAS